MKKILGIIVGFGLILNLYGCVALVAGAAGGAGTAAWLSGKYIQEVKAPYQDSVDAVKSTFSSMNLKLTKEISSSEVTQIRGLYTDGRKVWVDVRPLTSDTTRLEVRVGAFSDKVASAELLNKIVDNL